MWNKENTLNWKNHQDSTPVSQICLGTVKKRKADRKHQGAYTEYTPTSAGKNAETPGLPKLPKLCRNCRNHAETADRKCAVNSDSNSDSEFGIPIVFDGSGFGFEFAFSKMKDPDSDSNPLSFPLFPDESIHTKLTLCLKVFDLDMRKRFGLFQT
jgi:hypothetical protein